MRFSSRMDNGDHSSSLWFCAAFFCVNMSINMEIDVWMYHIDKYSTSIFGCGFRFLLGEWQKDVVENSGYCWGGFVDFCIKKKIFFW